MSDESRIGAQLESFPEMRRTLEASVRPLATSVDGRRFSYQASLYDLELRIGGYVVLEGDGIVRLGQVLTLELDQLSTELTLPARAGGVPENRTQVQVRYAGGEGVILEGDLAPFHDALVRVATGAEVQAWLKRSGRRYANLPLGELALAAGVPCLADASGFDRHTFLCGQSGSGKTYSLGVILERLLIETDLRLVVLDPNSDFVRLGQVRADADPALAERYQEAARGVAVYSADAPGERRLRLHVTEIDPATQAALLRLDPIDDREEYAELAEFLASENPPSIEALAARRAPRDEPPPLASPQSGRRPLYGVGARRGGFGPGRGPRPGPFAVSSSTWARCRHARSRHSWPQRCLVTCGGGAKNAARY